MLRSQSYRSIGQPKRKRVRAQLVAVKSFQYRYAVFLASCGIFLSVVVGGLTLYLLNHNYQMFARAELLTSPQVVDNLYRELKLANELIVTSLIGFVIFLGLVGIRFSQKIVVPILLVQEKMRAICKGDLKRANLYFRKTDEFQEFGETYNYMVESLKIQVKTDLEKLSKLKPDEKNRDAVHTWSCIVNEKIAQLNGPQISSTDQALVSHHAS